MKSGSLQSQAASSSLELIRALKKARAREKERECAYEGGHAWHILQRGKPQKEKGGGDPPSFRFFVVLKARNT